MNIDHHLENLLDGNEPREVVLTRRHGSIQRYFKENEYSCKLSDFKLVKLMGGGRFGKVYRAILGDGHGMVALKAMDLSISGNRHEARREIESYKVMSHHNVLKLFACFQEGENIYFVLELVDVGDLRKLAMSRTPQTFSEPITANFIKQIAQGVNYCHSINIVHRDLKPDNILISCTGVIKIGDFGKSIRLPTNKPLISCGTPDYMAPEIVNGISYDFKVDNWSIGIILYEFLTGKTPFNESNSSKTFKKILKGDFVFRVPVPNGPKELILQLLKMDSVVRISLENVISHPWINTALAQMDNENLEKTKIETEACI